MNIGSLIISTSPTIYLSVIGTANVTDFCGRVGAQYTNPVIPLPFGQLSSYSWDVPVGGNFMYQPNFLGQPSGTATFQEGTSGGINWGNNVAVKQVNVRDLACPTWGIASTSGGGLVVGPPFNPLIAPPPQLTSLDPMWAQCTTFETIGDSLQSWAISDPPFALTPAAAMGAVTSTVPATPAAAVVSADPIISSPASPGSTQWNPATATSFTTPRTESNSLAAASQSSPAVGNTPAVTPSLQSVDPAPYTLSQTVSVDEQAVSQVAGSSNAAKNQGQTVTQGQDPTTNGGAIISVTDESVFVNGQLVQAGNPTSTSDPNLQPSLGALIYSAFNQKPITITTAPVGSVETIVPIVVSGQSGDPTALLVDGTTIPISGISMPQAGDLNSEGSFILIEQTITPTTPVVHPTAVQVTTIGSGTLNIDGSTFTAVGQAATISNIIYSIDPSSHIIMSAEVADPMGVFTIGGQTITTELQSLLEGLESVTASPESPANSSVRITSSTFTLSSTTPGIGLIDNTTPGIGTGASSATGEIIPSTAPTGATTSSTGGISSISISSSSDASRMKVTVILLVGAVALSIISSILHYFHVT